MASMAPEARGWCPGALRPMASGDGLVVRVRPRAGALSTEALLAVANIAATSGNGQLDLTRRANVQIRGVTAAFHPVVVGRLLDAGLLDATPEAEAVRNVLVDPLVGLGPDARAHACARTVAQDLETILATDPELHALPAKFGFSVSCGGLLGVDGEVGDVRVLVRPAAGEAVVSVSTRTGEMAIKTVAAGDAAKAATDVARAVRALLGVEARRAKDLDEAAVRAIFPAARPPGATSSGERSVAPMLGPIVADDGRPFAVGLAAPFGRVLAQSLAAFARALAAHGVREVRVSPWRAIYVPVEGAEAARRVCADGLKAGFVTNRDDPLLRVDACPGAPACTSATVDTRRAARRMAPHLDRLGVRSLHVSGCAKGCARSSPADLVLVGDQGRFGVIRGGTARDPIASTLTFDGDALEDLIGGITRAEAEAHV